MRIDIMTLFPDSLGDVLSESILGRAQERGFIRIEAHQIRDYTASKQCQVDDYPYGGGRGAIMQADPLYRCWEHVCDEVGGPVHTIYLSPCGHTFCQADAIRLSQMESLVLVCGHYEGIDQRFIDECVDEELSLGDFVLTGGEIAAMAVTDAVCRHGAGGPGGPGVLPGREPFWRPFGVPAVQPPRPLARPAGAGDSSGPGITPRWPGGGESRLCAGPGPGGRICLRKSPLRPSRRKSSWKKSNRRDGTVELTEVTGENWKQAVFLTTDPERKIPLDEKWIISNAFSLLQARCDPNWDCRLLVDGETPVGFAFYGYWQERDRYLLCRYMIDVRYQGRGYGTRALPLVVEQIRRQYGCRDVYTTVDDENTRAVKLYRSFGFQPTEEMDEAERVYVLRGEEG